MINGIDCTDYCDSWRENYQLIIRNVKEISSSQYINNLTLSICCGIASFDTSNQNIGKTKDLED